MGSTSVEKLSLVPQTISFCSICILNLIEILHIHLIYETRIIRMVICIENIYHIFFMNTRLLLHIFLSFQYIVHCHLTSSTHLHFNIHHKCCSFLNGESNFQGDREEILSCLNYKHFMKSFKFIKSEFGVKSFGSSKKKISLLSHPLKARLTG